MGAGGSEGGQTPEAAAPEWTIPERFKGYAPAPPTGFGGAAGGLYGWRKR